MALRSSNDVNMSMKMLLIMPLHCREGSRWSVRCNKHDGWGSLSTSFSGITGRKLQFRDRQRVLSQSAASEQAWAGLHRQFFWRVLTLSPREEKEEVHIGRFDFQIRKIAHLSAPTSSPISHWTNCETEGFTSWFYTNGTKV